MALVNRSVYALVALGFAACAPASAPQPPLLPAPLQPVTSAPAAATTADPVPAAPETPSPFFPAVIHGHRGLSFFPLKAGGAAIDSNGFQDVNAPILLDEHGARWEPHLLDGVTAAIVNAKIALSKRQGLRDEEWVPDEALSVLSLDGDWPRSGTLKAMFLSNRTGVDISYAWSGSTWVRTKEEERGGGCDCCEDFRWLGRTLSFNRCHTGAIMGVGAHPMLAAGGPGCPQRIGAYNQVISITDRELIAVGTSCEPKGTAPALAVEHWRDGSLRSVVDVLPGTAGNHAWPKTHAYSARDIYLFAGAYVAHYDGTTWTDVSRSFPEAITEMWQEGATQWAQLEHGFARRRDGAWEPLTSGAPHGSASWGKLGPDKKTLWARFDDELWRLPLDGSWERVPLPRESGAPERIQWMSSGTAVVTASAQETRTILLSTKPDQILDLATATVSKDRAAPFVLVKAPTPDCKHLFVILYRLSRAAPADFDFPLTRAAIRGHTELSDVRLAETEDSGRRYLVAFVPNMARGAALSELVRDRVPGTKPQMLCGEPPVKRQIGVDLRTGALLK